MQTLSATAFAVPALSGSGDRDVAAVRVLDRAGCVDRATEHFWLSGVDDVERFVATRLPVAGRSTPSTPVSSDALGCVAATRLPVAAHPSASVGGGF